MRFLTTFSERSAHALRSFFFMLGWVSGTWIALIPAFRLQWGLDLQQLGWLLLVGGVGAVSVYPVAHHGLPRLGSAWMSVLTTVLLALAVVLMAWSPVLWVFVVGVYLAGAAAGASDSAVNAQAVEQERLAGGRSLMAGMHGFYSLGMLVAGGWVSIATYWQLMPRTQLSLAALVCVVAPWVVGTWLVRDPRTTLQVSGEVAAVPWNRALAMLGGLIVAGYVLEGSLLDWSGVYLQAELGASLTQAPWGFMAFSFAMVSGRFLGDRVIQAWGPARTLARAGGLAAIGMAVSLSVPQLAVVIVAYAAVGLGMSVVVPVLFGLAGRLNPGDGGRTVAKVAMMGYAGVLGGPALLGFLAHEWGLRAALLVLLLLALAVWRWGASAAALVEPAGTEATR